MIPSVKRITEDFRPSRWERRNVGNRNPESYFAKSRVLIVNRFGEGVGVGALHPSLCHRTVSETVSRKRKEMKSFFGFLYFCQRFDDPPEIATQNNVRTAIPEYDSIYVVESDFPPSFHELSRENVQVKKQSSSRTETLPSPVPRTVDVKREVYPFIFPPKEG